jgi:hypothetical protein
MNYWVVKGKPSRNQWDEMLVPGTLDEWGTGKPPKAWAIGDRIFFWESGGKRRVIALGELAQTNLGYWPDGTRKFEVRYLTTRLQTMPGIEELREIPDLAKASFLRPVAGTLFLLAQSEAHALYRYTCRVKRKDELLPDWLDTTEPPLTPDDPSEGESSLPATTQGFTSSPVVRRAIEEHAMNLARHEFVSLGYAVETHGKPFDLLCAKEGKMIYVEVKGAQGSGAEILLTKGEVKFHREHPNAMALFIVSDILVTPDGRASGGTVSLIMPWIMQEDRLTPYAFTYRV